MMEEVSDNINEQSLNDVHVETIDKIVTLIEQESNQLDIEHDESDENTSVTLILPDTNNNNIVKSGNDKEFLKEKYEQMYKQAKFFKQDNIELFESFVFRSICNLDHEDGIKLIINDAVNSYLKAIEKSIECDDKRSLCEFVYLKNVLLFQIELKFKDQKAANNEIKPSTDHEKFKQKMADVNLNIEKEKLELNRLKLEINDIKHVVECKNRAIENYLEKLNKIK